jgi:hypothetical protein
LNGAVTRHAGWTAAAIFSAEDEDEVRFPAR